MSNEVKMLENGHTSQPVLLGFQALQEMWVHWDLQDPEGPQDLRETEVLLGTKEPKVKVDFQVRQKLQVLGPQIHCDVASFS